MGLTPKNKTKSEQGLNPESVDGVATNSESVRNLTANAYNHNSIISEKDISLTITEDNRDITLAESGSSIANAYYIAPTYDTGAGWIQTDHFEYGKSLVEMLGTSGSDKYYVKAKEWSGYEVSFVSNGSEIEFVLKNAGRIQLTVDEGNGYYHAIYDTLYDGNGATFLFVKVAFGDAKYRKCKLRTSGNFGGMVYDQTYVVSKLTEGLNPLAVFDGSSITEAVNSVNPCKMLGYGRVLSDIMGWDMQNYAVGGTGILNDNSGTKTTLRERFSNITEAEGNINIIERGVNDVSYDITAIEDEIALYDSQLSLAFPDALNIIIGTYQPREQDESTYPKPFDIDALSLASCIKYGFMFVDLLYGKIYDVDGTVVHDMGQPLITGTGRTWDLKNDGNADRFIGRNTPNDSTHCDDECYKYMAQFIANGLLKSEGLKKIMSQSY